MQHISEILEKLLKEIDDKRNHFPDAGKKELLTLKKM